MPSLAASEAYEVSLVIKSFELRFVKQASTVVRDLMLLCFAPKSLYNLPNDVSQQLGSVRGGTPVALAMPMGDRALPTRRTIFTVIRGPHVHKASREQFQRLVHRRVIRYPTTSQAELQWFLDALKSYNFTGVQIQVRIGSSSFLTPGPADGDADGAAAAPRPLLADHMARFPHLFPAAALGGSSSSSSSAVGRMAASFDELRAGVLSELLRDRVTLHGTGQYSEWLAQQDAESLAAAAAAAGSSGGGGGGLASIGRAVADELARGAAPAAEGLEGALVAAARKVLLDRGLSQDITG
jgi:ribosomal protein S10